MTLKTRILLVSTLIAITFFACNQKTPNTESKQSNSESINTRDTSNKNLKLLIYYFHALHRCETCISIETNVKKVLDTYYKNEVSSGMIQLKVLCTEEEANKAITEKYEVTGASLHLVKIENGGEKDKDLTEFAFSYSNIDPDYFIARLNDTIAYHLK